MFERIFERVKNVLLKIKVYIFSHVKTSIAGLLVILVGGYFLVSFLSPKQTATQYVTASPSRDTLVDSISGTGTVSLANLRNLNFRSAGRVDKVNFKTGDKVKAGDIIAIIDKTDLQNTLAQSKSSLAQAQNNQKNRTLSNAPTKYDIANLQESIKTAEVKLSSDKFNLDQAILNSPVNGKIISINNAVGDSVTAVNANTGLPTEADKIALDTAVKSAQAKVDQDKQNLDAVTLMSPVNGYVVAVNNNAGDQVSSGGSSVSSTSQYDIANLQIAVSNAQNNLNNASTPDQKLSAQNALTQASNNLKKSQSSGNGYVVIKDKLTGDNINVNFGVSGKIKTVNAGVGLEVFAGKTLLGTLESGTYQTQLDLDQAALNQAVIKAQSGPSTNATFVVSNDDNGGQNQNISFLVSGRLAEINVKTGDKITKGQQLAKLDQTTLQNTYQLSQSSVNQSKNNLANRYASNAPTQYDLANLEESVNVAKIKVSTDQYNLDHADLVSPIDGTLTALKISAGDTVSAGSISSQTESTSSSTSSTSGTSSAIAIVSDLDHPIINLSVGESDISKIKVGQLAQISFDALGEKKYVGKVDFIDPNPTTTSNIVSYTVRLAFTKSDENIKPGMSASANIIVQTIDNALTVPASAIKTTNGQSTLQTMVNGAPQTVTVEIGFSDGTNTEIKNGLTDADVVITSTISGTAAKSASGSTSLFNLGGGGGNRGGASTTTRTTSSSSGSSNAVPPGPPGGF